MSAATLERPPKTKAELMEIEAEKIRTSLRTRGTAFRVDSTGKAMEISHSAAVFLMFESVARPLAAQRLARAVVNDASDADVAQAARDFINALVDERAEYNAAAIRLGQCETVRFLAGGAA